MTLSLKKYVSTYTNSTTNRGVEAKEVEIANTRLDLSQNTESSNDNVGDHAERTNIEAESRSQIDSPQVETDETASYIQVVVQKHHKKRESLAAAAQTSARLPMASSPIKTQKNTMGGAFGDAPVPAGMESAPMFVVPHPMMLTYTVPPPPQNSQYDLQNAYTWQKLDPRRVTVEQSTSARSSSSFKKLVRAARGGRKRPKMSPAPAATEVTMGDNTTPEYKPSFWKKMGTMKEDSFHKQIPERVEVYYFERGWGSGGACGGAGGGAGAHLATTDGTRTSRAELWCSRVDRLMDRVWAELFALPQCLAMQPVNFALHVLRCACVVARGGVAGALQTLADYLVKPVAASAYNCALHPPLVCLAHIVAAVTDALRPATAAVADLATLRLRVHHV